MRQDRRHHTPKSRVITFLIVITILSATAAVLDRRGLFGHAGSLAYMWCPGLAAIISTFITARSFKAIGWTTRPKWLAIGWLIPVVYASLSYGLVWITGLGGVPSSTFLQRARITLNMPGRPDWMVIAASFAFISVALLPPSMISGLGEEIGWRGFLFPELSNWVGPRVACIVSGVIWAAWHTPAFLNGLWSGRHAEGLPDCLFHRDGALFSVCHGLAALEVWQHLAHCAGPRNTQFSYPAILRSHHGESKVDAVPYWRVWLRHALRAVTYGLVLPA